MVNNSSAKYHQKNKKRPQKSLVRDIKFSPKKKKKKGVNTAANDIKIFLNMASKGWLNIEKSIMKYKEVP